MAQLEARNVSVELGKTRVLHDVSAGFCAGQLTGLIGPNGAGKSTLLKALCNVLAPVQGSVCLKGTPLSGLSRKAVAKQIAYLPQGHTAHWPLAVEHVVALGRLPHLGPVSGIGEQDQAAIDWAMDRMEVSCFRGRTIDALSGGERARVMLARALAGDTPVLLVDEPVISLDPYHQLQIMELLRGLADEGKVIVCVLHDLALVARFCHTVLLMAEGRVLSAGAPASVLSDDNLRQAFSIQAVKGQHDQQTYVLPWQRANSASSN